MTNEKIPAKPGSRQATRGARHTARYLLWDESTLERVRNCGRKGVARKGEPVQWVTVRATGSGDERRGGFAGLETCGSTWACPVCSARIAADRGREIATAVRTWQAQGGSVAMVTLTMRHSKRQSLIALWDALGTAWQRTIGGKSWQGDQALYGVAGWCRVVEVTHGEHGWHVHVHALLFLNKEQGLFQRDPNWSELLGASMFSRWSAALVKAGLRAPLIDQGGLDVRVVSGDGSGEVLGDYFTKTTYSGADRAAMEATRGGQKDGRNGNRTPFTILRDVMDADLHEESLRLWRQWEKGSAGRKQLTWAKGFRARLLAEAERTDEEIAADSIDGEDLAHVDPAAFRRRVHRTMLDLAEVDDRGHSLRAWLTDQGIRWRSPMNGSGSPGGSPPVASVPA